MRLASSHIQDYFLLTEEQWKKNTYRFGLKTLIKNVSLEKIMKRRISEFRGLHKDVVDFDDDLMFGEDVIVFGRGQSKKAYLYTMDGQKVIAIEEERCLLVLRNLDTLT